MLGATVAIVAVVGLGWTIGISPKLTETDAAMSNRASVDAQNASHEASLVTLRAQFADLEPLAAELVAMQQEVPATPNIENFIDEINGASARTGVTIGSITASEATAWAESASDGAVAPPAPMADDPEDGSDTSPPADATDGVYTIAISMDVVGSADQLMDFADAIQTGRRYFLVNSVNFAEDAETAGGTVSGYLLVARIPTPEPAAGSADVEESTVAAG